MNRCRQVAPSVPELLALAGFRFSTEVILLGTVALITLATLRVRSGFGLGRLDGRDSRRRRPGIVVGRLVGTRLSGTSHSHRCGHLVLRVRRHDACREAI